MDVEARKEGGCAGGETGDRFPRKKVVLRPKTAPVHILKSALLSGFMWQMCPGADF